MPTTVNPGIILQINGQDVPLTPSDASTDDLKKTGAHYELASPVDLGSIADLSNFLSSQFGAPALPAAATFPTPLDQVYTKLTQLELGVDQASVTIPPTLDATGQPLTSPRATSFTMGLTATWPAGQEVAIIPGKLSIKGIFLLVQKDDTP